LLMPRLQLFVWGEGGQVGACARVCT
jgi:hypothetical protein